MTLSSMSSSSPAIHRSKCCHLLPCSIAYDGPAPIHMYFEGPLQNDQASRNLVNTNSTNHETENDDKSIKDNANTTMSTNDNKHNEFYKAQFRGRQLMAAASVYGTVKGRIGNLEGSSRNPWEEFDQILEWHHTSSSQTLPLKTSRVATAFRWCRVASSLHDPLPIVDDEL